MSLSRSAKVSEVVARSILEDVVARSLEPGTMLPPESEMLKQHQVGRASLREALRILEIHGLISVKTGPGGGPVLTEVASSDFGRTATFFFHATRSKMRHLWEARLVLEPMLTRIAAERIDEAGSERLRQNLEISAALIDDPGRQWGEVMSSFHRMVAGMTGNPVLDLMGSSLTGIHADRANRVFEVEGRKGALEVHRDLAEVIIAGDGERAEELARAHIQELNDYLARVPHLADDLIAWH